MTVKTEIELIAMDVDGVLTDGGIIFDSAGVETKRYDVTDGFAIYDARLWRSGEHWQSDAPYALELTYRRNISASRLVSTSIEEMMRLGEKDEQRLRQWRSELEKVFPSVREGDTIVGLHEPGRGARFFYNGKPSGSVQDAELAAAFFAIWLDPRTKAPELRARLLAASGS